MESTHHRSARPAALLVIALLTGILTWAAAPTPDAHAMMQPFVGVTPQRFMETRTGAGKVTVDGLSQGEGKLTAAATRHMTVLGRGTIPATGVAAVAINVTAVNPSGTGFLTIFPKGASRPTASNLNTAASRTLPNMVVVPLGTGGEISVFNSAGTVDVVIDVLGWFPTGSGFTGATPQRLLDTRGSGVTIDGLQQAGGAFTNGETRVLPILGRGDVPNTGIGAVALNVTAIAPSATGFLTIFPTGVTRPNASNLNTAVGRTLPNMVIVPVGADGSVSIFNSGGTTQLAVDVLGWFPSGTAFTGVTPQRLLDTRASGVTVDGQQQNTGTFTNNETRTLPVTGRGTIPATGVGAVAVNVTAINPSGTGFLTIFPAGAAQPTASNLNTAAGRTVPNMVIVPVGTGGAISIFNSGGSTHLAVDILGWFPAPSAATTQVVSRAITDLPQGKAATNPTISRNGTKVAFVSAASSLVAGDTNQAFDVFVVDVATGAIERASVALDGSELPVFSSDAEISDDGRYVTFTTAAAAVPGDGNGANDVYRRDLLTGVTVPMSVLPAGGQFVSASGGRISGNGNIVAFKGTTPTATGIFVRDVTAGTTVLVSDGAFVPAGYTTGSTTATSISQDGDKIAVAKQVTSSSVVRIFRYDRSAVTMTQMSPAPLVGGGPEGGTNPVLSDDGEAVVYERGSHLFWAKVGVAEQQIDVSTAGVSAAAGAETAHFAGATHDVLFDSFSNNLVAGDTNGTVDVFLRTTGVTKSTTRLNVRVDNGVTTEANSFTQHPRMATNGNVVWDSAAGSLVPDTPFTFPKIMLQEGVGGPIRIISRSDFTAVAHGTSDQARMSADGRFVAFSSTAEDLVFGERLSTTHTYLFDRTTQAMNYAQSVGQFSGAGFLSTYADISDDGKRVLFLSPSSVVSTGNGLDQAYVVTSGPASQALVSSPNGTTLADAPVTSASLSANGRFVVFATAATNITAPDSNNVSDVFVRDLQTGTIERVSLTSAGAQINGASGNSSPPSISADGRFVIWTSSAINIVPGATTAASRVYVRDRTLDTTTLINFGSIASISDDGKSVLIATKEALLGADTNAGSDVYLVSLATGATELVSVNTAEVLANGSNSDASMSPDGRFVTFVSAADNLVAGDTNGEKDVFLRDRLLGTTIRVNLRVDGSQTAGSPENPQVSADGRIVIWATDAIGDLGDRNHTYDVYLRDTGVIAP